MGIIFITFIGLANAKTINCLVLTQKINNELPYTVGCIEGQPCLSYSNVNIPRDDVLKWLWFSKGNLIIFVFGLALVGLIACLVLMSGGNEWIIRQ